MWGSRKKETKPVIVAEPEAPKTAIEGFAANSAKPSKHMSKKAKRQARRDAKVRLKILITTRTFLVILCLLVIFYLSNPQTLAHCVSE